METGSLAAQVESARRDPRKVFSHYVLLSELGAGGMGVVYKAFDDRLRRVVALKMLLPGTAEAGSAVKRFHREAEAIARLRHPNIVQVFETGEHEGKHYLSMDFVEGQTLARRMKQGPPLPIRTAVAALRDVARALEHAHGKGVIHRDLKPQNIMLDENGHAYVLDFGLARVRDARTKLTKSNEGMGTPAYMPPEQADGRAEEIDERSDVYSLGATLYFILAGRAPFSGTDFQVMAAVLTKEPERPSSVNPLAKGDLETVCLKCMEKENARRYASAGEVADELERWLAGEPILAREEGAGSRLVRRARKNVAKLALALLLLGLLGGGAVYVLALQAAKEQAEHDRDLARATPTSTPRHEEPTWKPPSLAPNTFALLTGTDAPGPRAAGDLPMVVWDGKRVLALSGTVETGSSNALHVYDPLRNVWTVAIKDGDAGAPPKRHSGTLAWDGARAFLFGGMRVKDDGPGYHNDLWSYDPASNTWTKKIGDDDPGSPPARYGHSMFWDGSRLILFGGYREESRNMNDLWAYDPRTNVWEARPPRGAVPSPRMTWSSMVWTGKQAILFGGGGDTVSNDLWWYEPGENHWVQKTENGALGSPPPRNGPATAWDGKRLFVFGGEAGGQKLNDLWAYDPADNSWIERIPNGLANSPRARASCAMVPIGAGFLLFGGWTGNFDIYLHDVWLYRP